MDLLDRLIGESEIKGITTYYKNTEIMPISNKKKFEI